MKSFAIAAVICASTTSAIQLDRRREPLLTWSPKVKKSSHPVDYPVPNFGEDHDIRETKKSFQKEEARQGHFWDVLKKKPEDPPRDYFVPNYGVDQDIKDSVKSLDDQEKKMGKWSLPKDEWYVQTQREPLLTWKPREKKSGYPMDYAVPHFGSDAEVTDSLKFASAAEARLGHQWTLKTDPDTEKYIVPEPYKTWDGKSA